MDPPASPSSDSPPQTPPTAPTAPRAAGSAPQAAPPAPAAGIRPNSSSSSSGGNASATAPQAAPAAAAAPGTHMPRNSEAGSAPATPSSPPASAGAPQPLGAGAAEGEGAHGVSFAAEGGFAAAPLGAEASASWGDETAEPPTPSAPIAPSAPMPEEDEETAEDMDGLWLKGGEWYVMMDGHIATSKGQSFSLNERTAACAALWNSRESYSRLQLDQFVDTGASIAVPEDTPFQRCLPSYTQRHADNAGRPAKVVSMECGKAVLQVEPGCNLTFDIRAFPLNLGRRCWKGCDLKGEVSGVRLNFNCDGCAQTLPTGSPVMGCRGHDFDLCMRCAGFQIEVDGCRVFRGPTHPKRNDPSPGVGTATANPEVDGGYNVVWGDGTTETCRGAPFQDLIPTYNVDVNVVGNLALLQSNTEEYSEEVGIRLIRTNDRYEVSDDGKQVACRQAGVQSLVSREVFATADIVPKFHVQIGEVTGRVSVGLFLEVPEECDQHIGQAARSIALTGSEQTSEVYNSGHGTGASTTAPLKEGDVVSMHILQGRGDLIFFVNGKAISSGTFSFQGKFRFGVALDSPGSSVTVLDSPPATCATFDILSKSLEFEGSFCFMDLKQESAVLSEDRKSVACPADAASKPTLITSQLTPSEAQASFQVKAVAFPMVIGLIGPFPDSLGQDLLLGDTLMEGSFGIQAQDTGCAVVKDGEETSLTETPLKDGDIITIGTGEGHCGFYLNDEPLFALPLTQVCRMAVTLSPGAAVELLETPPELQARHRVNMFLTSNGAASNKELREVTLMWKEGSPFQFADLHPSSITVEEEGARATCTAAGKRISLTRQAVPSRSSALCNFKVVKASFPILVGITPLDPEEIGSCALGDRGTLAFVCLADGCSVAIGGKTEKVCSTVVKDGDDLTVGLTSNGSILLYINGGIVHALKEATSAAVRFAMSLCVEGSCLQLTPPPADALVAHAAGEMVLGKKPSPQDCGVAQALKNASRNYLPERGFEFVDLLNHVDVADGVATVTGELNTPVTVLTRDIATVTPGTAVISSYTVVSAKLPIAFGMSGPEAEPIIGHLLGANEFSGTFGIICAPNGCLVSVDGSVRSISEKVLEDGDTFEIGWSDTGKVRFIVNGEVFDIAINLNGNFRMAVTFTQKDAVVALKKPSPESIELFSKESTVDESRATLMQVLSAISSEYDPSAGFRFLDLLDSVNIHEDGLVASARATCPCTVLTGQLLKAGTPATCLFKVNRPKFPLGFGVTGSAPEGFPGRMLGQDDFKDTLGLVCMSDGCYLVKAGKIDKIPGRPAIRHGDVVSVSLSEGGDVFFDIGGARISADVKLTGTFRVAVSMLEEGTSVGILTSRDATAIAGELMEWGDFRGTVEKATEGPRATVYKARLAGSQNVILKACRAGVQPTAVQQEVRALQHARHPHIIPVYGCVRTPQGEYAIVTDAYPCNLAQFIGKRGRRSTGGALAFRMVRQVAGAVEFFNRRYAHGGLKPSNIFVTSGNEGVLGESDSEGKLRSHAGADTDTVMYLAPEVLEGGEPTEESDVYALGMLLRFVLVGNSDIKAAFDAAEGPRAAVAREAVKLPTPQRLPEVLEVVLQACLSSNPDERPSSKDLAEVLLKLDGGGATGTSKRCTIC